MPDAYWDETDSESIIAYLKRKHNDRSVAPSFRGYKAFQELLKTGAVTPEITSIRLYINDSCDEHYIVMSETEVEGVELKAHSGREGRHNIEQLLQREDYRYWEVSGLNPAVYR